MTHFPKKMFGEPPRQKNPFEDDPTKTVLEDPIEGIATSHEWKHPEPLEVCPVQQPQAARWQEHAFYLDSTKLVQLNCGELARFFVPAGYQGRISKIETAIQEIRQGDPPVHTPVLDGGLTPYAYDNYDGWRFPCAFEFHLRLQTWVKQGLPPGPEIVATEQELPGTPHPSLGSWPDARYDYARRDNHVSLFVQENMIARLFVQLRTTPTDGYPSEIYGRLAGITQLYRGNAEAIHASRMWP